MDVATGLGWGVGGVVFTLKNKVRSMVVAFWRNSFPGGSHFREKILFWRPFFREAHFREGVTFGRGSMPRGEHFEALLNA